MPIHIRPVEGVLTLLDLFAASAAVSRSALTVVIPAACIGWQRQRSCANACTEAEAVSLCHNRRTSNQSLFRLHPGCCLCPAEPRHCGSEGALAKMAGNLIFSSFFPARRTIVYVSNIIDSSNVTSGIVLAVVCGSRHVSIRGVLSPNLSLHWHPLSAWDYRYIFAEKDIALSAR